jgi:transposase
MVSVHFTEEDRQALNYERFHYPDPRVQQKMEVLWLVSQGLSRTEVAQLAGVSARTVRRYIKRYKRGGIEALKRSEYHKPQSELDQHAQTLKEYFEKNPPSTVKQAQAAIEKLTGVRRGETQVTEFLKRIGLRRRKVGTVPGKVDEAKKKSSAPSSKKSLIPGLMKPRPVAASYFLWMPAISCMAPFSAICGLLPVYF